ncbi:TolB family protein [candidate division KSB1 bacterium]
MKNTSYQILAAVVLIFIFSSCGRIDILTPAVLGFLKGDSAAPVDSLSLPPPPEELGFMSPLIQRSGIDSEPDLSHTTGNIVFVSNFSGSKDIWSANSSGLNLQRLTTSIKNETTPVWNHDGTIIAFSSDSIGVQDVWKMSADGEDLQVLTPDSTNDIMPTFNSNSSQIAFTSDRSGNLDIWIMSSAGGSAEQLTTSSSSDFRPDWSPDGNKIAFISDRTGTREIWCIDVKSLELEQVTDTGYEHDTPAWSPTGQYIAYAAKKEGNWDVLIKEYGRIVAPVQATISNDSDTGPTWLSLEEGIICVSGRTGGLDIFKMIFFSGLGK